MNQIQHYAQTDKASMKESELESRAFICTASNLNRIKENWEAEKNNLPEALEKNRMLWSVIVSAMKEQDCPQPQEVRNNMINLAMFVFKRTMELLADPEPERLNVLININMNIARGLNGNGGV